MMINRDAAVSDCYVWMGSEVVWNLVFKRVLHHLEEAQYKELYSFLSNVFLCREEDSRIWKPTASGIFTVKSFCASLGETFQVRAPCASARAGLVAPSVGGFLLACDSEESAHCRFFKKERLES